MTAAVNVSESCPINEVKPLLSVTASDSCFVYLELEKNLHSKRMMSKKGLNDGREIFGPQNVFFLSVV